MAIALRGVGEEKIPLVTEFGTTWATVNMIGVRAEEACACAFSYHIGRRVNLRPNK